MRLSQLIVPAFLAVVAHAQVKIEPPSPYMSSPPPAEADTTVIDPGRKPNCETQPGLAEAWYADWNLSTDRPSAAPLQISAPRRNMHTFRVAFDDNGWPTEVAYYDAKGKVRWTKLFKYPARIPAGPGGVPYSGTWIGSNGKAIQMDKVAAAYKQEKWEVAMKKYRVGDALGEPLIIEVTSVGTTFSAKAETWVYLIDGREVRFPFDKDNRLVSLPVMGAEPPPPPVLAAPEPPKAEPAKLDKPSKKGKAKGKEAKSKVDSAKADQPKVDSAAKVASPSDTAIAKEPAKPDTAKPALDSSKVKPQIDSAAAKPAVLDSAKAKAAPAKPAKPSKPAPRYRSKAKMVE